ncbi:hypothetical protein DACRYDRAFT_13763 [Dacryopinax primogenitus]|uniref:Uncharacterized protein n=1 Tax=Dacryopinax primogenitus (strain DJM 731) TaxID=1858805 RepID=M5GF17_DACPD|nr:uncharacterized protein DACRYDRAFT_13763 [Dacryopinax primogenitus]EJU05897.1 hypothetical protein DACRYDRAFT_13763 [Dacryopinax primogenitus]
MYLDVPSITVALNECNETYLIPLSECLDWKMLQNSLWNLFPNFTGRQFKVYATDGSRIPKAFYMHYAKDSAHFYVELKGTDHMISMHVELPEDYEGYFNMHLSPTTKLSDVKKYITSCVDICVDDMRFRKMKRRLEDDESIEEAESTEGNVITLTEL